MYFQTIVGVHPVQEKVEDDPVAILMDRGPNESYKRTAVRPPATRVTRNGHFEPFNSVIWPFLTLFGQFHLVTLPATLNKGRRAF